MATDMNVVNRHWAPLALEDAGVVLAHYAPADRDGSAALSIEWLSIEWHSERPFSSAAIVRTPARRLFVKRHAAAIRTPAGLAEEHGFLRWLAARGLPVSTALSTAGGASTLARDGWTYEVHEVAQGIDLYRDVASWEPYQSVAHARAAGAMLGRLHRAARGYPAPARTAHVLVSKCAVLNSADPIGLVAQYARERAGLASYLAGRPWRADLHAVLAPWHAAVHALLGRVPTLWTHNDWHPSNLLWDATGAQAAVRTVLDFGLADRTNAAYDLATAIERSAIPWLDIQAGVPANADLGLVAALLEGYLAEHPLSLDERRLVGAILPVVHVEFALAEVDYYAGLVDDAAYADLAYESFLLGHARWFDGAAGRELLRFLGERLHDGQA